VYLTKRERMKFICNIQKVDHNNLCSLFLCSIRTTKYITLPRIRVSIKPFAYKNYIDLKS